MKSDHANELLAVEGAQMPRGSASLDHTSSAPSSPSCRILISPEASQSLDDAISRVTKDFDGGRIGRTQIASWLLQQAAQRLSDSDIEKIRATFFDRVAYLETLLRRAKETGTCPPELDALFDGRGSTPGAKKRAS
jgi:hypothetical protein